MIGKTLGHYHITSQIGKGGMGEVFQAKDQVLGREVAIKVLPEEYARDADRVARFQREAKVLASLNHSNIASIHGLEESGGTKFLVLELVEGNTLADRIKSGPIPIEESLKLALQIAEALEAAHEKGIIHRDLKPANIKVTPDGKVKVLDFGLAKAFAGDQEVNLSNSPTLSDAATRQGVILGTAAYMSPEQARGKPVDKRADIWAFGCLLYEMLTGQAAFQGEDVTEILAAVVKGGANLDLLPANLHPRVREAITRCLQKDQKSRYSSITDARYEIEQALADPGGVLVQPIIIAEPRKKLRAVLPWIAAVVILSVITGAIVWKMRTPEPRKVMRFAYELPEGRQFNRTQLGGISLAVSPDGSQFVYGTTEGLYLRLVDALDARLIVGTDKDSVDPFFSPDGQWIGYISKSDLKLKKIAISGGAPVVLCDTGLMVVGARWDSDNMIVYSDLLGGGIMWISANGGTPESLIKINVADARKSGFPAVPQMLPDGRTLLFTNAFDFNVTNMQIVIQSLKSGERKILLRSGFGARYLSTGHLVYQLLNNNIVNLLAIPFNLDKLEVTGGSVPVLEGIGAWDISDSGTLVYVSQPGTAAESKSEAGAKAAISSGRTLVWVNRQGKEEPLAAAPNKYSLFKISPDGTRVALTVGTSSNQDIWIWDVVRENMTRLTFDKGDDEAPLWTPDGKRIVYSSNREAGTLGGIYWKAANGTGEVEKLVSNSYRASYPSSMSKDGKTLALWELTLAPLQTDIGMLSMESNHARKPLLQEKYNEDYPQISPDGRWLAYQSNESGKYEVYVRSFPNVNKGGRWQISTNGGDSPLWSPDGQELFYRSGDSFMAVEVETDPAFRPAKSKILFKGTYFSTGAPFDFTMWDISPDGKRFLMLKPHASTGATPTAPGPRKINIVLNWFEELKKQVPSK
jgi:serine/threonine protein kinase/Tol biopolymer transport system component